MSINRKYPIGAEIIPNKGVHFRIWAPDYASATVILEKENGEQLKHIKMKAEKDGYFSALAKEAKEGAFYRFRLGRSSKLYVDPASRFQPLGTNGPSCVVNPKYNWTDKNWNGLPLEEQVIYEMHIGTFTQSGTFKEAIKQLPELASLGITTIELMPINTFSGHFGWGYDGVNLFAPMHHYGNPQQVKAFINKAHSLNLAVILDIVYNHLGPEDNQLYAFTKRYIHKEKSTEWGDALNFDEPGVREFFLTNIRYWVEEYHFDGFRVDSTHLFFSTTESHILSEMTHAAKKAGRKKKIIMIGENEDQNTNLLRSYSEGGNEFDALWNDDFHHSGLVRLTGKREAYYTDFLGGTQEFISLLKYGFLYQGQYYDWKKEERGVPNLKLPKASLVVFLENHDQVANSGYGLRLHQLSDPGNYKALTALLLLGPNTPMLFQGQEFGSSKPFTYFADHREEMRKLVFKGRKGILAQFPRLATSEIKETLSDPGDPMTFIKCKLDFKEREVHQKLYLLHKDLIKLRRSDPVFKAMSRLKIDGAALGTDSFLIRYFGEELGDRLLIVNFGADHHFTPAPEPLLVAGINLQWTIAWSSESSRYGGEGTPPINLPYWKILGHSAIVLKTAPKEKKANH